MQPAEIAREEFDEEQGRRMPLEELQHYKIDVTFRTDAEVENYYAECDIKNMELVIADGMNWQLNPINIHTPKRMWDLAEHLRTIADDLECHAFLMWDWAREPENRPETYIDLVWRYANPSRSEPEPKAPKPEPEPEEEPARKPEKKLPAYAQNKLTF